MMGFDQLPHLFRNADLGFQNVDADGHMRVELALFVRGQWLRGLEQTFWQVQQSHIMQQGGFGKMLKPPVVVA